jgi:hypothetical protein
MAPVMEQAKAQAQPSIGAIEFRDTGSAVVSFQQGSSKPSIRVMEPWSVVPRSRDFPPQILKPVANGERLATYETTAGEAKNLKFCFDKMDNSAFIPNSFGACDLVGKSLLNSGPLKVVSADYVDPSSYFYKQELIYLGKSGNTLKFTYREFGNAVNQTQVSQDVTYDLSEGTTVGYKGARIEVISSSQNSIKYRMMRHFE